ncbi:fimbrial protein [uncultured Bacteroides sp.]|nr:fimbrial protein [uncultured Bacteroides sp.]
MKRIIYKLTACCASLLLLAACHSDDDMPGKAETAGNNIIIDIASGTLPVSRATVEATGAEIAVSHIDVLVFEENGIKAYHERAKVNSRANTGTITLTKGSDEFAKDAKYWVYLIANSTHAEQVFADLANLDALRGMTETTENIHITGLENATDAPMTFLMDGVAYEGANEPSAPAAVVLHKDATTDRLLKVTLRRAAAKIVVRISKGDKVTFNEGSGNEIPAYYLRNMPYTTSIIAGVDATPSLRIPPKSISGDYLKWTPDEITVTAYAYAHKWGTGSDFQNKVRMVINIPLKYTDPNNPDNSKEEGNNWYQVPVSESKKLARNTYYEVKATVNALGGVDPSKPTELTDLHYSVVPWEERTISVGGEQEEVQFLYVNEEEMEMHNMDTDETTLRFNSSSPVTATVTRAYYIDKFGQEQNVNINNLGITATPEKGLAGSIRIYSPKPTNNAIRYIKLNVTNEDGATPREVTVAQYPLEYITNIQGWYSYRDDFNGTHWENPNITPNSDKRVSATSYNSDTKTWTYSATSTSGFFTSKVAEEITSGDNKGKSTISYYYYNRTNSTEFRTQSINGLNNARMYHVKITASSGDYTLGKPRITNGKTDPGADNAKLVSPSFMLASQLGAVFTANSIEMAASHCEQYVEVAKNGKVYNDWRLPTTAELQIISEFQRKEGSAMDVVLTYRYYYSARETVDLGQGTNNTAIRCIRDAYNDTPANP